MLSSFHLREHIYERGGGGMGEGGGGGVQLRSMAVIKTDKKSPTPL